MDSLRHWSDNHVARMLLLVAVAARPSARQRVWTHDRTATQLGCSSLVGKKGPIPMRFIGIIFCLLALGMTGYSALSYKAPEIEADIKERTELAVAALGGEAVGVHVDGRHITLRGKLADDGKRRQLLDAARQVAGGLGPVDGFERLAIAAPFRFEATKGDGGDIAIAGQAPDADLRALMIDDAKAIFGNDILVEIALAEGVPAGDWRGIVGSGMDALATLKSGRLAIVGQDLVIEGDIESEAEAEAIDLFQEMAPKDFSWTTNLTVARPTVTPYTFVVIKDEDGGMMLKGFVPDAATRDAMIDQAKVVADGKPVIADIQIADGMPDEEWPGLVQAGIGAMAEMGAGKFDVSGNDMSFASDVADAAEHQAIEAAATRIEGEEGPAQPIGGDAAKDGTKQSVVENSATGTLSESDEPAAIRSYAMTVDKIEEGNWSLRGVVPDTGMRDALLATIKKLDEINEIEAELDVAGGTPDEAWQQFVIERLQALTTVTAGRLVVEGDKTHLIGVVETVDDIEAVDARLAAIDADMTTDLQPVDPRPAASLDLVVSPKEGVILAGALPEGLSEKEAALALGLQNYKGRLKEDGRGDAEAWRQDLVQIGSYLPQFEQIGLALSGDQATIEGKLHAHGDADQVAERLLDAFGPARNSIVEVKPTDQAYAPGTRRINPLDGQEQVYQQGYWLPVIETSGDLDECSERSSQILASNKITFLRGEATLDASAENTINVLAALAIQCLNDGGAVLEIGGHTDSRGAEEMNQELSQARADVVLRSLTARGVEDTSLLAVGYGDTQPIADNTTDDGRAQNRRITFEWKASGRAATKAEG